MSRHRALGMSGAAQSRAERLYERRYGPDFYERRNWFKVRDRIARRVYDGRARLLDLAAVLGPPLVSVPVGLLVGYLMAGAR